MLTKYTKRGAYKVAIYLLVSVLYASLQRKSYKELNWLLVLKNRRISKTRANGHFVFPLLVRALATFCAEDRSFSSLISI